MPIPELDTDGFLPPGVHDCTLPEIKARFGTFQRSDRRVQLYRKLDSFVSAVTATNLATALLVDGSFVTAKQEPNDVDLVVVLKRDHDFDAGLRPKEYNVVSKRRVRRRYGFDILVVVEDSSEFDDAAAFFQQIRERPETRKGILRLRT